MRWFQRLARRLDALRHKERLDRELTQEIQLHLELEAEELVRTRGLSLEEARRQARIAFGGVQEHVEAQRDARGVRWIEELWQDLRYGCRSLLRSPAFSLSTILVLAVGIGACTAMYGVMRSVLLARLPYPQDDRLVRLYQQNSPTNRWALSVADYQAIDAENRTLGAVGVVTVRDAVVSAGGEPTRLRGAWMTSGLLRTLGVGVADGRRFEPADDRVGAPAVVIVSAGFAHRTYGTARAVGRVLTIDGIPHAVAGVLPANVTELAGIRVDLWPILQLSTPPRRGPFWLRVIGRLREGTTLEAAQADLAAVSIRLFPRWATSFQDSTARIVPVPLRTAILGNVGRMLTLFGIAVGLVLLIAVVNVATLTLVRFTARWREVGLRTALGAGRSRLIRWLLAENLLLAAASAAVGVVLGTMGLELAQHLGPTIPRLYEAQFGVSTVLFAVVIAAGAGVIISIYPIAALLKAGRSSTVPGTGRHSGAGRATLALRGTLVAAEFALALPLLAGAGLLLNSFLRLMDVDPGFDPAPVSSVRVSLPRAAYREGAAVEGFWTRALSRVRDLPGVEAAGLSTDVPPSSPSLIFNNFDLIDHPVPPGQAQPVSPWLTATGDYFSALGVSLEEGRLFNPGDSAGTPPVVIVSHSWARHYFPEGRVVGRQLISGGCVQCQHTTVIGVVGDVKYQGLAGSGEAVYSPLTQEWDQNLGLYLLVRARGPAPVIDPVRSVLHSVDPSAALDDAAPMADRMSESVNEPRRWTLVLSGFAVAALGLAALGIFGMLSYVITARQREIGVRMALGAERSAVVSLVLRQGMRYAVIGAAIGLLVAVLGSRWLEHTLYEVKGTDPATLALVTILLMGSALVACWLPARRAAQIDPVEAIRAE